MEPIKITVLSDAVRKEKMDQLADATRCLFLAETLQQIEIHETNYQEREVLVYRALSIAKKLNYPSGIRFDSTDNPPWPVVCITLPNGVGEVSWHCPPYTEPFTGYDTAEKYKRCQEYAKRIAAEETTAVNDSLRCWDSSKWPHF